MKLLFLDSNIPFILQDDGKPFGGASIRVFHLIQGFTKLGHQAGILTWTGAKKIIKRQPEFDIVESFRSPSSKGRKIKGYDFLRDRVRMYQKVKSYKPDVLLQVTSAMNTGVMALIGKLLNIPFVFLVASDADTDGTYDKILNRLEVISYEFGVRRAQLIVCQNSYQCQQFKKRFGNKNIAIISNPFHYRKELPPIQCHQQRKYVMWLGNFTPVKNLPFMYQLVRSLPNVKFKIAGSSTNKTSDEILNCLERLNSCDNVELLGNLNRDQVFFYLSKAYLLVNTSHFEGFSNTFLEALAVGTPIVSRESVDPDQIISKHGLGCAVKSYEEMGAAINTLIEDQNYDVVALRCKKYVADHHGLDQICNQLANALESIIPS